MLPGVSGRFDGWRDLETPADGGGGVPVGAPAPATAVVEPPAPPTPPAPVIDPAEHQRLVQERARLYAENVRFKLQAEFPQADWEMIQLSGVTDETVMRQMAERSQGQQPQPPATGAPVPPANSATSAPTEEEQRLRKWQRQVRHRASRGPRTAIEPWEAEEARDAFFRLSWNGHMQHRRRGYGNVGEPPPFQPPTSQAPPQLPLPGRAF